MAIELYAIIFLILALSLLGGMYRLRLTKSSHADPAKQLTEDKAKQICEKIDFEDAFDVDFEDSAIVKAELQNLLLLLALNRGFEFIIPEPARTYWSVFVRKHALYQSVCSDLFGVNQSPKHEILDYPFAGDVREKYDAFLNLYVGQFGGQPPTSFWPHPNRINKEELGGSILFLSSEMITVNKVVRRDGEHLKTEYFGGFEP